MEHKKIKGYREKLIAKKQEILEQFKKRKRYGIP
jgi:hypothetical protein